jgi:hypothetical protein
LKVEQLIEMSEHARLEWIREKTCKGLGIDQSIFDQSIQTDAAVASVIKFLDGGKPPCASYVTRHAIVIIVIAFNRRYGSIDLA